MSEGDNDDRPKIIRLCVDLNVWIRYLLGIRRGAVRSSASSTILDAVETGQCNAGPVQLVISHTMLSRLEDVLVRLQFQPGDASAFCSLIRSFSDRGPRGVPPYIILDGGTSPSAESRMPMYDPYNPLSTPPRSDDEDGRVLDTAIAGRANILATYNFDDFQTPNRDLLERGQLQIYRSAQHSVMIAHAQRVAEFMTTGQYPVPRPRPGSHRRKSSFGSLLPEEDGRRMAMLVGNSPYNRVRSCINRLRSCTFRKRDAEPFRDKKSFASFLQKRRFFFLERKKQRTFHTVRRGLAPTPFARQRH